MCFFSVIILFAGSCKDAWDDHVKPNNTSNQLNLLEALTVNHDYDSFIELVKSSGYDKELESSKNFTVWAPTNQAIVDFKTQNPSYLTTPDNVKAFVAYHIAFATYKIDPNSTDTLRLKTLRGKYVYVIGSNVDDITVVKANNYAKNGIYHSISTVITPKLSIWNILKANATLLQSTAVASMDTTQIIGTDTLLKVNAQWTPIRNRMLQETDLYTYFLFEDNGYTTEYNRIKPYYTTTYNQTLRPDSSTTLFTNLAMLRDVMVRGLYTLNNLPDTLVSVSGMKIPINKAAITSVTKASNGIVYRVSSMPYRLTDRIPSLFILGQNPIGYKQSDKRGNTFFRTKVDDNGRIIKDIEVYGHGVSQFYIDYRKTSAQAVKYKVYARATSGLAGDPQTIDFTQRFQIQNPLDGQFNSTVSPSTGGTAILFTHLVTVKNFKEVYLGDYTKANFGNLNARLISAANTSTTAGINTLILEYLRFEPVLP